MSFRVRLSDSTHPMSPVPIGGRPPVPIRGGPRPARVPVRSVPPRVVPVRVGGPPVTLPVCPAVWPGRVVRGPTDRSWAGAGDPVRPVPRPVPVWTLG